MYPLMKRNPTKPQRGSLNSSSTSVRGLPYLCLSHLAAARPSCCNLCDTTLSDAERYPLKLSDLIVIDVDREAAPIRIMWAWGNEHVIDDIPTVGFTGDRLHSRMYLAKEVAEYAGAVISVDPSGRDGDETSFRALLLRDLAWATNCVSKNVHVPPYGATVDRTRVFRVQRGQDQIPDFHPASLAQCQRLCVGAHPATALDEGDDQRLAGRQHGTGKPKESIELALVSVTLTAVL